MIAALAKRICAALQDSASHRTAPHRLASFGATLACFNLLYACSSARRCSTGLPNVADLDCFEVRDDALCTP